VFPYRRNNFPIHSKRKEKQNHKQINIIAATHEKESRTDDEKDVTPVKKVRLKS